MIKINFAVDYNNLLHYNSREMMGVRVINLQNLRGIKRLFLYEISLTILVAVIAFLFSGSTAAISALLGGVVSIIPNICFASKLFRHQGANSAKKIINDFYKGEALKIFLSVVLFALVFKFIYIMPLVFFAVYIMVQICIWFAPFIFDNDA